MPAPVYDAQTMQPVDPAPEDLAAGFAAGRYGFDASAGKVLLKDAQGTIYHAAPEQAARFIASGKYSLPSADEELAHQVHKEEEAKGALGSLKEGAESAINQATFGVEEAIASGGLTEAEKKIRELRQGEHTAARVAGGALGVGASMFYGGEVPGIGRVPSLFKGAEAAGEAVSHLVLPAAREAEASLFRKTAAAAANYAAQGAALSAPQAMAQAAFGDPQQAAETLLWGFGAGTALGAGAELLGSAARGAAGAARGALLGTGEEGAAQGVLSSAADKWANEQALRSAGAQKAQMKKLGESGQQELGNKLHEIGLEGGMSRTDIGDLVAEKREEAGQKIGETIDKLDNIFSESNGYTVGKAPAETTTAAPPERVKRSGTEVGQYLRDNPDAAKALAETGKIPDEALFREAGNVLETPEPARPRTTFATASDSALEAAIKPGAIGNAIREVFDTPEMQMEINSASRNAFEMIARDADRLGTRVVNGQEIVDFRAANDFATALRGQMKKAVDKAQQTRATGVEVATPLEKAKAQAYDVVRSYINTAADKVALASGNPELDRALASSKNSYRQLKQLEEMTANYTAQAGNKPVSLTDQIHAGQGMASAATSALGGGLGALVAGPAGAMVGGVMGRAAGIPLDYLAKKWFEDKGLIYLSTVAKRAAKDGPDVFSAVVGKEAQLRLDATMKGVGDTVRRMATTGIEATAASTNEHVKMLLGGSTTGLTHDQSYAKLTSRVNDLAANPAALASVTAAMASPFVTAAPDVAFAYQQKLAQAVMYLHQSIPKSPNPPAPFTPQTWSPSPVDKMAFHDKAQVVSNPMAAMQHVANGTLSDAHLDALKTVWPATYAKMQGEIMTFAADHPDVKLPMSERASIAKFLGAPLDPMTAPTTMQALQAAYQSPGAAHPGAAPKGRPIAAGKLKKLAGAPTTFGRTAYSNVGNET